MPDYLAVPEHRRDRAVHEKARMARRGELRWIRLYADDLDEDVLFGETPAVRFLDVALLAWASRTGWLLLYDARAIAGRYGLRGREVKPALERLVELRRFELIHAERPGDKPGEIQPALFPSVLPASLQSTSGVAPASSRRRPGVAPASDDSAQTSRAEPTAASDRLARARGAEKRREGPSSATSTENAARNADRLPADLLEIGWNPRQIAVAAQDVERVNAWLDYARREPGLENLGGYVWARFAVPDTWPNGARPPTTQERIERLEAYAGRILSQYARADAIAELDERLVAFPDTLRPALRQRLLTIIDQEPEL
jgi:hypothetical protein